MEVFLSACLLGSVILSKMERIKKKMQLDILVTKVMLNPEACNTQKSK